MPDINKTNIFATVLRDTRSGKAKWIPMDLFKTYLKTRSSSLVSIPILRQYLITLQKEYFIFDCYNSYITLCNDRLYVFAKNKNPYPSSLRMVYRLDYVSLNASQKMWERVPLQLYSLRRLRNVIAFTNQDLRQKEDCVDELLSKVTR